MTTPSYTTDTSAEALEVQFACLRDISPQERIRRTCAMSKRIRDMGFAAIRRRHPECSEEETQLLLMPVNPYEPSNMTETRRRRSSLGATALAPVR